MSTLRHVCCIAGCRVQLGACMDVRCALSWCDGGSSAHGHPRGFDRQAQRHDPSPATCIPGTTPQFQLFPPHAFEDPPPVGPRPPAPLVGLVPSRFICRRTLTPSSTRDQVQVRRQQRRCDQVLQADLVPVSIFGDLATEVWKDGQTLLRVPCVQQPLGQKAQEGPGPCMVEALLYAGV